MQALLTGEAEIARSILQNETSKLQGALEREAREVEVQREAGRRLAEERDQLAATYQAVSLELEGALKLLEEKEEIMLKQVGFSPAEPPSVLPANTSRAPARKGDGASQAGGLSSEP